ncbi:hypothetical protein OR16_38192 [Cupriavidus basilensis OR16]|uniref:DUF748 domain-containing protein n=1 Tax=Cupriavidus basilensis OR16 TaxID=1127483 RepID=H1SGU9_9BURK|nr:DUF748 domain-containing protein [Cupriavidus basilensis]EHP38274.1 hypothetical protein OR16_38192 [Cupriavidus basilensis OR16]
MAIKFSMQAATATPRRRAGLRVAGGIVAALAVFGLAGYFGGPPLIKSFAAKQASEALGRKVTFGGAEVQPFSLAVDVSDITIYEPDGTTPMLTVGEARIDGAIASLWHFAPVVDAVHIDRPVLHLARDANGRMNYADIEERFAARPPAPKSEPARFSVNNIALTGGGLVFDDKLLNQTQRVDNLTITLPFLSNLPHDVEIVTRPTLSANINGSALALDGTMLPFAASRETHLNINLDALELARYMPFAPKLKDADIKSGLLDSRLTLGFIQDKDKQDVFLAGTVALRDADIRKHDGSPLVKAGRVAVDIARIEPLGRMAHLRSFTVDGLAVQAVRRADGSLDLAEAFLPEAAKLEKPAHTPAAAAAAAPASAPAVAKAFPASAPAAGGIAPVPEKPWRYAIDQITVKQARLGLRDDSAPSGPATLALGPFDAAVAGLSGDSDKPAKVQAKLTIGEGQTLSHEGELSLRGGTMDGTLQASGVKPQGFAAWWPAALQTQLGDTAVNADLHYKMAWGGPVFAFSLEKSRVELAPLYLTTREPVKVEQAAATNTGASQPAAADSDRRRDARRARARDDSDTANLPVMRAERVALEDIAFDLGAHSFQASQLVVAKPQIAITRDFRGELLESARLWAVQSGQQSAQRTTAVKAKAAQPESAGAAKPSPWKAQLGKFTLDGGSLRMTDYAPAAANRDRPVVHQFRNVSLGTGALNWPMAAGAIPVKLKADVGRRGAMALDGTLLPTAPAAQLQVDFRELDLAPLQPYLADRFNAALRGGTATVKGRLGLEAPAGKPIAARFTGNALLGNVRSVDRVTGDDFLRWRSLAVSGIDFAMDEAKGPMKVGVAGVALSDFYARVILNANGRLNLQDVMAGGAAKGEAAPSTSLTQANPASAPAASAPAPAPAPAPVATAAAKPQIRIGGVTVDKGNVNFSDFFVKPNYTANLTDMKGSVSKLSSTEPAPANLTLAGRIDDDAPVTIDGKLNPLADTLYLDIAAKAAGVELTRLTPYAAKYAGYPITKGKLTVDVAYKVENGKLDARNHLYLDQLTFGDKVDSPSATKLPVLLAVSLLKDRNGVIDINLPVSGSLSDPEFSIGGVILRVIVNLLAKAITSPFSLIGSAFGGGDELGYVEFAPGTSTLTPAAKQKIATLGKALADRPALRLEISGRIDPATDTAGAKRAWLDARVAEQKSREMRASAKEGAVAEESEEGEQGAKVTVSPQEYPKYLEAVYKRASFKKPRNMIGLSKSLPTKEMESLLLENAPITDVELRQLAEQRALAVKQALERDAKVPESRLFLTASKLNSDGIKDKGAPNRVDFTIRQ